MQKERPAQKFQIVYRARADLRESETNARTHTDEQVREIAGSIRRFGFVNPILIAEDDAVIAGHGRLRAAEILKLDMVPAIVCRGLSNSERRALALADNRIAMNSAWDMAVLRSELQSIQADDASLVDGLGFGEDELAGLMDDYDGSALSVDRIETTVVADEFWINIRGPLADQATALQSLRSALKELPETKIELGTIAVDW